MSAEPSQEFERGLLAGVRYVLSHEEHYDSKTVALTADHRFGDYVLEMRPPRKDMLSKSKEHLEQRIRAISHSASAVLK